MAGCISDPSSVRCLRNRATGEEADGRHLHVPAARSGMALSLGQRPGARLQHARFANFRRAAPWHACCETGSSTAQFSRKQPSPTSRTVGRDAAGEPLPKERRRCVCLFFLQKTMKGHQFTKLVRRGLQNALTTTTQPGSQAQPAVVALNLVRRRDGPIRATRPPQLQQRGSKRASSRAPQQRQPSEPPVPLDTPCCLCDTDLHLTHQTNSLDDATVRFFLERNLVARTTLMAMLVISRKLLLFRAQPLPCTCLKSVGLETLVLVPFSVHRTHLTRELFHACAYHIVWLKT